MAARPSTRELSYDAPMYQDYFWVAMLDPVELADGQDADTGDVARPALLVDDVAEVDHFGRAAWEAVVRPTDVYEPRCGCCPLLRTRRIALLEYAGTDRVGPPADFPEAFRVRLDVGTGVCVLTEEIGGRRPARGTRCGSRRSTSRWTRSSSATVAGSGAVGLVSVPGADLTDGAEVQARVADADVCPSMDLGCA